MQDYPQKNEKLWIIFFSCKIRNKLFPKQKLKKHIILQYKNQKNDKLVNLFHESPKSLRKDKKWQCNIRIAIVVINKKNI